jgi:hypothetical protein
MTRGKKPAGAIRDAKKFAEKMGYRWQENTDNPDLGYDLLIFKPDSVRLIRVRVTRYTINPDTMYEDLLPADLAGLRGLPFPQWFPREIWLRTQHERTFRRLMVYDGAVGEVGFWEPDGYVNPHARD